MNPQDKARLEIDCQLIRHGRKLQDYKRSQSIPAQFVDFCERKEM